jgi:hypothetical protein
MEDSPLFICEDCALDLGADLSGQEQRFLPGRCDICDQQKIVHHISFWSWPDHLHPILEMAKIRLDNDIKL